jgi:hypothetical protein
MKTPEDQPATPESGRETEQLRRQVLAEISRLSVSSPRATTSRQGSSRELPGIGGFRSIGIYVSGEQDETNWPIASVTRRANNAEDSDQFDIYRQGYGEQSGAGSGGVSDIAHLEGEAHDGDFISNAEVAELLAFLELLED